MASIIDLNTNHLSCNNLANYSSLVSRSMMRDLIVTVEQGQLKGKSCTDYKGGNYYSYHAIPYAKPPIGELRFKAPQPPENWLGIRDATQEGDECYSRHMLLRTMVGSEDCLILNVYTRNLPNACPSLKPVMVWIHGGAFIEGSSKVELYGPEFLITEDVVIVSINYRLGVLGFLSMEDPIADVPGNAACKDIVMALEWVQKNIRYFCGDPDNVTIFGESAGAALTHLLMLSPMATGLFQKVISQSGSALNTWSLGKKFKKELAEVLGCNFTDDVQILKFLQQIPVEELLKGQHLLNDNYSINFIRPFGPVIEKISPDTPAFLTEKPLDIILQGKYTELPLLMGYNSKEGMYFDVAQRFTGHVLKNYEDLVPHFLKLKRGSALSEGVAKKIKEFYYGTEEPSDLNRDKFYIMTTDGAFFRGIYSSVKNHAVTSSKPVFLYRFSVDGDLNLFKMLCDIKAPGACHGDDLGYLFKTTLLVTSDKIVDENGINAKTIYRMKKLWANFARTGDPTPSTDDPLINMKWKPVTSDRVNFMDIGVELMSGVNPEHERMAFWDEIIKMNPAAAGL